MIDLCDNWAAIEAHRADGVHRQPGGHGAVPQIRFRDRGHQPRLCHARRRIGRRLPYGAFALRAAARRCVIVPIRRGRCAGLCINPPNLLQALAGLTAAVGIFSPLTPLGAAMPTSAAGRRAPQPDTDVPGLKVGAAQDNRVRTGTTVILPDSPAIAAVDVRGGGRHRETDALGEDNLVQTVDALTFSGGSVYGTAAADGVAAAGATGPRLRAAPGPGCLPYRAHRLPVRSGQRWRQNWQLTPPYRQLGIDAVGKAGLDFPLGTVGAGYGAMTGMGKLKGGLGSASIIAANGATVGALVAVNSLGAVVAPGTRAFWATPMKLTVNSATAAQRRWRNCARRAKIGWNKSRRAAERTPACIATDTALTRVELKRWPSWRKTAWRAPSARCTARLTATWCSPCPPGNVRFRAAANWRCCRSARWRRTPAGDRPWRTCRHAVAGSGRNLANARRLTRRHQKGAGAPNHD